MYSSTMDGSDHYDSNIFPRQLHEYTQSLTAEQQEQLADALQMQWQQEQHQQQLHLSQLQQSNLYLQEPIQNRRSTSRSRRSPRSSSSLAFAAWARAQATSSAYFLVGGGILCLLFPGWWNGVYSMVLGILVYIIEQRCSSNNSSSGSSAPNSPSRSFSISSVFNPHSVRAFIYIITAVPCFLRAPNYSGGICLAVSGVTYATAAIFDWRKRRQHQRSKRRNTMSTRRTKSISTKVEKKL